MVQPGRLGIGTQPNSGFYPGKRDRSEQFTIFRVTHKREPGLILMRSLVSGSGRGGRFGGGCRWGRRTWRWVGLDLAVCGVADGGGRFRVAGRRTGPQRSRRGLGAGWRTAEQPGSPRLGREARDRVIGRAARGPAVICAARSAPAPTRNLPPRPVRGRPQDHRQPAAYDVTIATRPRASTSRCAHRTRRPAAPPGP